MNMFDVMMDEIFESFEEVDKLIADETASDEITMDEITMDELTMDEILYYERMERLENEWEDAAIALGLEINR